MRVDMTAIVFLLFILIVGLIGLKGTIVVTHNGSPPDTVHFELVGGLR